MGIVLLLVVSGILYKLGYRWVYIPVGFIGAVWYIRVIMKAMAKDKKESQTYNVVTKDKKPS